jgi:hypothetical protein
MELKMMRSPAAARSRFLPSLVLLAAASCASPTERAETVQRVDDLLARIERVQVDAVVSKEASQAPLDKLSALCATDFAGDAKEAYTKLLAALDLSQKQARKLRESVEPMQQSADSIFRQWTTDLQAFGNSRMRQRSQTRLDETQSRYQAIYASAQSSLIAYDAYNADLRDRALFLGHDLNASSVAELASDIQALQDQVRQLGVRLDAAAAAARAYVEAAALYGQSDAEKAEAPAPAPDAKGKPADTSTAPAKKKSYTLKKHPASSGQPAPAPQPEPTPESDTPTTEPSPTTNPPPHPTTSASGQHPG